MNAETFAIAAHLATGQRRKYTNEPYWYHCRAVSNIVARARGSDVMIAAAWLHDVVEDTKVTLDDLSNFFPLSVVRLVEELTDVYTSERYPTFNRRERKNHEAARYAKVSNDAKTIKLADLIDNTSSIGRHDPSFAKVYFREKEQMLIELIGGDERLHNIAVEIVEGYYNAPTATV